MSVLFYTGFDASTSMPPEWVGGYSTAVFTSAGRRGGNYLAQTASNSNQANFYFGGTNTHIIAGFACYMNNAGASDMTFASLDENGVATHIGLQCTNLQQVKVARGANVSVSSFGNGTALATTTSTLTTSAWNYIEIEVVIHDTLGELRVWINGQSSPDINLTGLDTRNGGSGYINQITFGKSNTGIMDGWRCDDIYVVNTSGSAPWNARLGDVRCDVQRPNANGTNNDSTPSTGTDRYATIDETNPSTTDYNSLAAVGDKDTLNVADLAATGSSLIAVKPILFALKADAGTCEVCPVIRSGGTDYDGTSAALNVTSTVIKQIYETNPDTGLQWTEAGFNAAEFGYKRTA